MSRTWLWLVLFLSVLVVAGVWLYYGRYHGIGEVTYEDLLVGESAPIQQAVSGKELLVTHAADVGNIPIKESVLNKLLLTDHLSRTLQLSGREIEVIDIFVSTLLGGSPVTFKIPLLDKIFVLNSDNMLEEVSVDDIDYQVGEYLNISFFYVEEGRSASADDIRSYCQGKMSSCLTAVELGLGGTPVDIDSYLNSIKSGGAVVEIDPSVMVAVVYYD